MVHPSWKARVRKAPSAVQTHIGRRTPNASKDIMRALQDKDSPPQQKLALPARRIRLGGSLSRPPPPVCFETRIPCRFPLKGDTSPIYTGFSPGSGTLSSLSNSLLL
ncbi:UNVERIFIED_CONTAM: hypothetical protein Sangu_2531100 [Sesamum angustifolium]|uniref:Uncharacterized protein n=1 Tax=Sesamum angustifolium TaxID=2727405 RepID=A0AAW2JCK5_9LAMI